MRSDLQTNLSTLLNPRVEKWQTRTSSSLLRKWLNQARAASQEWTSAAQSLTRSEGWGRLIKAHLVKVVADETCTFNIESGELARALQGSEIDDVPMNDVPTGLEIRSLKCNACWSSLCWEQIQCRCWCPDVVRRLLCLCCSIRYNGVENTMFTCAKLWAFFLPKIHARKGFCFQNGCLF